MIIKLTKINKEFPERYNTDHFVRITERTGLDGDAMLDYTMIEFTENSKLPPLAFKETPDEIEALMERAIS